MLGHSAEMKRSGYVRSVLTRIGIAVRRAVTVG